MRVRAGKHALHADRAVEHTRLAALASVRAVLPTHAHPAVERTMYDGDAPLEDSVRDGAPATAGAPSTGGVHSSCCVAMSRRAARAPRPAAARRPEGPGSTRGQTVDNQVPDRAFALYRALFGIDELTQEKGTIREPRLVHPKKYAKIGQWTVHLFTMSLIGREAVIGGFRG